jgi:hypothetical protein
MSLRQFFPRAAILGLVTAAACSGDSTSPRSSLSGDEAANLAMQLNLALTAAMPTTAAAAARMGIAASSAPQPITVSVDRTVPCPMGGQSHVVASLAGSLDTETESMDITLTGSQSPANCGFDVDGVTFHTNGDPSLVSTAHIVTANGLPVGTLTFGGKGKFNWNASDGRAGSCSVDYTMSLDYTAQRAVVSGSFCGTRLEYNGPMGS